MAKPRKLWNSKVEMTGPVARKPLSESLRSYAEAKARKKQGRADRRDARAKYQQDVKDAAEARRKA